MKELISEDELKDSAAMIYKCLKSLVNGELNPQQLRAAASGGQVLIAFKRLEQNGSI